nr:single-stranded DNA-binding protein [Lachnospiraceae bacterium]
DAYAKYKLCGMDPGVFTPKIAIERAMDKYPVGSVIDLRKLYTDEEWATIDRGERIAFGRNFYSYTSSIDPGKVRLVPGSGNNGRRAKYELLKSNVKDKKARKKG